MPELTQADTGIPKANADIVSDAETQVDDAEYNKLSQAAIYNSRTGPRYLIKFTTNAGTGYPVDLTFSTEFSYKSHWGTDEGTVTIQKTAANTYAITLVASRPNIIGSAESPTVGYVPWKPHAWSTTAADDVHAKVTTIASNVLTLVTESPLGTGADVGDSSAAAFTVEIALP